MLTKNSLTCQHQLILSSSTISTRGLPSLFFLKLTPGNLNPNSITKASTRTKESTFYLLFIVFEMENNCGIMGLKEDEMELELGLSIGGIFGKGEKLKPVKNGSKNIEIPVEDCRESVDFDPKMQRKIQALRRHEARKKREEKQQKRWRCQQNGEFRRKEHDDDDVTEERDCKKNKVNEFSGDVKFYLNAELNHPSAYPVFPVRVPYPYPHLQFVPVANGFPYSCVNSMPSWGYGAGNVQVAAQPVAMNGGLHVQPGHEQNNNKNERIRESGSNGSSPYSSSIVSDLQSSSNQGGHRGRDEPVTNTTPSQQEHPQTNCRTPSHQMGQSDQSCTSHQMDYAQSNAKSSQSGIEKTPSMNVAESTSLYPKKAQPKPESQSSTKDVNKGEIGKAPKPQTPPIHDILRHMPCVSTTGNGPDGKTINGFLYRYTKSEVSIICVCHGNSFTPAEFVQHAGGNDVAHPLRHITVIPSAIQKM